ncbi:hypothetical protein Q6258_28250, partial [Klebsiella pneumoniae]|nr:hypothetical protein [Klebsiella pneumoniae]
VKMTSLASVIQYSELLHNAQNIYYANARKAKWSRSSTAWRKASTPAPFVRLRRMEQKLPLRQSGQGRGVPRSGHRRR